MSDFANLRLSPYYLNTRRLAELTDADIPIVAQRSINENSAERAAAMRFASGIANALLKTNAIPSLGRILAGPVGEGSAHIAQLWDTFSFKGVSEALMREQRGKARKAATVTAEILTGESEYRLAGQLSNEHMYSDTSATMLSRRRRMLLVGRFELDGDTLEVEPYIIGDVMQDLGGALRLSWAERLRIYPGQIDAFAGASRVRATAAELEELRTIPEEDVKHAFAAIVGEPFVPKDWGGEKSDLQTSRVHIDGTPTSAAFIFKGPSVKGELHPATMGKRGDQLVRAFDEPVELIVVQHCNKIANSVVRFAEALAADPGRPRRYCIIDGEDTVRILKACGMFPPPRIA